MASKANADASVPSKEKLIKAKVKSQRLKKKEEETLLIYTAQGSPLRRKKLSVINGSPEQKVEILKAGRSNSDLPELPNNHS